MKALPERGRIGIHNRSYYEEVLVARVHPEILAAQQLPADLKDEKIWKRRFREINDFEQYLVDNGTVILKFFLHVSKEEQKKRFLARIDEEDKNWKFSVNDVQGARVLGRLHARLRGHVLEHRAPKRRALVHRSGRQQVVHAPGGGGDHLSHAREAGPRVSDGHRRRRRRNCRT